METTPSTQVKARKPQVRPPVMRALTAIVETGAKIPEAAQIAGMQYESLRLALKRPHVREALASIKRAWLESETFVAWNTVADLQRNAASEDVRLKSARMVIGASGELEPGDRRRSDHPPVMIQIVTAPSHGVPLTADDRGVVELPPWRPGAAA